MASRKRKNLSGDDLKAEEEFESKLIGIVLLYPILWDMGHSEYKKQVSNGAVWEKSGRSLRKARMTIRLHLAPKYLKTPSTAEEWNRIATKFWKN
uniref:Uncharacterized protein n=1 Tax=Ditylenchus dipsaci TaxID=166011 RepID=A0A915EDW7_9BILA